MDTLRRLTVLSDGRVPIVDGDLLGNLVAGSVDEQDLVLLHRAVTSRRRAAGSLGGLAMAEVA